MPRRFDIRGVCLLALALLAGCDNTIDPILEGADGEFAVFGFLDTSLDTQLVRVEGPRPTAGAAEADFSGVDVYSVDDQGRRVDWDSTPTTAENGDVVNLFAGRFRPDPATTYTLFVAGPGGTTQAVVTTPAVPEVIADAPVGDSISLRQVVRLSRTSQPLNLTLLYSLRRPNETDTVEVAVDYGQGGRPDGPDWAFDVFLRRDHTTAMVRLDRSPNDTDVTLLRVGVEAGLLSPEWAFPRTQQNISSGLGFFGAIGRYRLNWTIDGQYLRVLGYQDGQ